MYDNLKSLGITNPDEIDRYSLRQEANNDILKIYFQKDKGEFFAKSVKFKYPRQRKTVVADGVGQGYKEVQEISPNLRYVIDELDQICQRDRTEIDLKRKILDDLRHLESVVTNKISEIEADLEESSPVSETSRRRVAWQAGGPILQTACIVEAGYGASLPGIFHLPPRLGVVRPLRRDMQRQPVVKATEIQASQLRDTVQPVLQRIAMNKQRL